MNIHYVMLKMVHYYYLFPIIHHMELWVTILFNVDWSYFAVNSSAVTLHQHFWGVLHKILNCKAIEYSYGHIAM